MKRGAIFDMDGTLVDTERFYRKGWLEVADTFGYERKPELAEAMSGAGSKRMPEIIHSFYPDVDAEEYGKRVREIVRIESEKELNLMSGVKDILDFFKSHGVLMAVASSSRISRVEPTVKRAGIWDYFKIVIGGDQIKNGKPAPDIFLKAAEELALTPADCYVFEDSINGVHAGYAAGCETIMVEDLTPPTDEIRKKCRVFDSMTAAMEAIKCGEI